MNIKEMEDQAREELQKQVQEFFNGADTDQEFNKRMNEFENMFTLKREILQKSKKKFCGILDAYIQGTLTKEKALLLLQSKHQQLGEEIKNMAVEGCFVEIDYKDGKGYMPEEFMKIVDEVNYYYNITKDNIGNVDIKKLGSFSSPAVKRVVESVGASFDKYFGTAEKKESQPEQETQPIEKKPSTERDKRILELKRELNTEGSLLDDLITVPSSANLETITEKYWEKFENVIPEMFTEFICQSRNKPYSTNSIKEAIKRSKPPAYHREKPKKK